MSTIAELERDIEEIKQRNRRVESDKAWETSFIRRVAVTLLTYFVISLFMYSAGVEKPFVSSLIPAVAYFLSTTSLRVMKDVWLSQKQRGD